MEQAGAAKTDTAADRAAAEREAIATLMPGREVRLTTGEHVLIEPWGVALAGRLLLRIQAFWDIAKAHPESTVNQLIALGFDEAMGIVQITVGWDDDRMAALTMEDAIALATATIEICMIGGPEGGLMSKMVGLVTQGTALLGQVVGPALARKAAAEDTPRTPSKARPKRKRAKKARPSQTPSTS